MRCAVLGLAAVLAAGCQKDLGQVAPQSDATGKVAFADGKPVGDVLVNFLPQFKEGTPASATTDAAGAFKVKISPGKYAYTFEAKAGKADAFKAVPAGYKEVSGEHLIDVGSGPITLTLAK